MPEKPHDLGLLISLTQQQIPAMRATPGWWSSYIESPEMTLPPLLTAFEELRKLVAKPKARLLDCGSGDGTVMELAAVAGFNEVVGIELESTLLRFSQQILQSGNQLGWSSKATVKTLEGSYYIPEYVPVVLDACCQQLRDDYALAQNETDSLSEYTELMLGQGENAHGSSVAERVRSYLLPLTTHNPYTEGNLIDSEGFLGTDVIYIFPSDYFFQSAFIPQMSHYMREQTLLAVLSTGDEQDRGLSSEQLRLVQQLPIEYENLNTMSMDIYSKVR